MDASRIGTLLLDIGFENFKVLDGGLVPYLILQHFNKKNNKAPLPVEIVS
jgi:hypothetical protein